jgi:hypothetical protein
LNGEIDAAASYTGLEGVSPTVRTIVAGVRTRIIEWGSGMTCGCIHARWILAKPGTDGFPADELCSRWMREDLTVQLIATTTLTAPLPTMVYPFHLAGITNEWSFWMVLP